MWRIGPDGVSLTGAAAAVPMPLGHTVELNAGTVDTDAGPQLQRRLDVGAVGAGSGAGQPARAGCGLRPWPASARMCEAAGAG